MRPTSRSTPQGKGSQSRQITACSAPLGRATSRRAAWRGLFPPSLCPSLAHLRSQAAHQRAMPRLVPPLLPLVILVEERAAVEGVPHCDFPREKTDPRGRIRPRDQRRRRHHCPGGPAGARLPGRRFGAREGGFAPKRSSPAPCPKKLSRRKKCSRVSRQPSS